MALRVGGHHKTRWQRLSRSKPLALCVVQGGRRCRHRHALRHGVRWALRHGVAWVGRRVACRVDGTRKHSTCIQLRETKGHGNKPMPRNGIHQSWQAGLRENAEHMKNNWNSNNTRELYLLHMYLCSCSNVFPQAAICAILPGSNPGASFTNASLPLRQAQNKRASVTKPGTPEMQYLKTDKPLEIHIRSKARPPHVARSRGQHESPKSPATHPLEIMFGCVEGTPLGSTLRSQRQSAWTVRFHLRNLCGEWGQPFGS